MSIIIEAKSECRIVPLRFTRASSEGPHHRYPYVDDRGHQHVVPAVNGLPTSAPIGGAVLPMGENKEVEVKMIREDIDASAPLFITSSDSELLSIVSPKLDEQCSDGKSCTLTLKSHAIDATQPKLVYVEVRFGKVKGPIIAKLATYIFPTLIVKVQPYYVTIDDHVGNSGLCPAVDYDSTIQTAQAIWSHYGVDLMFAKRKHISVKLNQKNYLCVAEINEIYKASWINNYINVYFVQQLEGQNTLSYGFTPQNYSGYTFPNRDSARPFPLTHPGVFIAMKNALVDRSKDPQSCAKSMAHEIGHFFALRNINLQPTDVGVDDKYCDYWSMKLLMKNQSIPANTAQATGNQHVSYCTEKLVDKSEQSTLFSGTMVTLKNCKSSTAHGIDGQCSIARNHISKGFATLY